jgi:hypothetical protein
METAELARRHVVARVGVLAWELGEEARKKAWRVRPERDGPESSAYLRFVAQIDGRALMGAPALAREWRAS